jgi:predicted nucleotidyltransferase
MRLTASEIAAIREEVGRLDPKAEVYLYGSPVDDTARGGDVDLLVISETLGFREVLRLSPRDGFFPRGPDGRHKGICA